MPCSTRSASCPTDLGRLVNGFLTAHFNHYIDYDFTARMEDQLDFISNGEREWVPVLRGFWNEFSRTLEEKQDVNRGVPLGEQCPKCKSDLYLQNSKRGLFVGCSAYPKCDYTRPWGDLPEGPINLGKDPVSGLDVLLMRGPYGSYAQLGPTVEGAQTKPRRASWPQQLADRHRRLGDRVEGAIPATHTWKSSGDRQADRGQRRTLRSVREARRRLQVRSRRATACTTSRWSEPSSCWPRPRPRAAPEGKQLGPHPIDNQPVQLMEGRYGPYIKHGKVNVTVPSDMDVATLTLDDAVDLLAEKAAKELAKTGSTAARPIAAQRPANQRGGRHNAATVRRVRVAAGARAVLRGEPRSAWRRRPRGDGLVRMAVARKEQAATSPTEQPAIAAAAARANRRHTRSASRPSALAAARSRRAAPPDGWLA